MELKAIKYKLIIIITNSTIILDGIESNEILAPSPVSLYYT